MRKGPVEQERFHVYKLDLKDAYLTVPIHPSHWRFLRFHWQGKVYEYAALPFGLATAPRLFTMPVLANLTSGGVRLIGYLDDFLVMGKTKQEVEGAYMRMKSLLESLGFIVNAEKLLSTATQRIEFLGFIIVSPFVSGQSNDRTQAGPTCWHAGGHKSCSPPCPFTTGPFRH